MEAGRVNWNDDRIDRLADQVEVVRGEVSSLRLHMDERFEKQEARIEARFDRLQNSMIVTLGGILAAFGGLAASTVF
jgi:hypothetical protein